jgi:hypothetical protein
MGVSRAGYVAAGLGVVLLAAHVASGADRKPPVEPSRPVYEFEIKTGAFGNHCRLADSHSRSGDDILLARIGNLSASDPTDTYAGAEQLQYRQGFAIQPRGRTDSYRKLAMRSCRLGPAQRCIDDPKEAGCSLDKIAAQIAKVVRRGDSSENDDGRAMHPG